VLWGWRMEIALDDQKNRIYPSPNLEGYCPICSEKLIPKCGTIKVWHWSHQNKTDCDNWYEPETIWHKEWKDQFDIKNREVVIGKHRADIFYNNLVIELQNSSISAEEIIERENFYKNMLWILNGSSLGKNILLKYKEEKNYYTFRWKHPPKSWWVSEKQIYVDLNPKINKLKRELNYKVKEYQEYGFDSTVIDISYLKKEINILKETPILLIKKIYKSVPCGGWGYLISKRQLIETITKGEIYG